MKIDDTGSSHMLYKSPMENVDRFIKGVEIERVQSANETPSTTSVFMDNSVRGSMFDAKA